MTSAMCHPEPMSVILNSDSGSLPKGIPDQARNDVLARNDVMTRNDTLGGKKRNKFLIIELIANDHPHELN